MVQFPFYTFSVNATGYPINLISGVSLNMKVTGGNWNVEGGITGHSFLQFQLPVVKKVCQNLN